MSPRPGISVHEDKKSMSLHELLAMVMHEMRAPLSSLTITVDVLLANSEQLEPREIHSMLQRVQRSTSWIQALVENLSIAAQLEVSELQLRWSAVDLREALDAALLIVQPSLDRERQRVDAEGVDGFVVRGESRRIEQILVNLMMNASKYGRPATTIEVAATVEGEWVRVEVRDKGHGIPADEHDRIFQRYVRGSAALRSSGGGLGLGLHIVKTLVELHGGTVGVSSQPGAGATFWFTVPAVLEAGHLQRSGYGD